ncbi:urease accessory protein UreF [Oscillatoriales cyanobacterium LEGE 11467]|uniref:Urease accessory protein UreF n=1 Tax=Zarconia navalis LEGE 11467 TaxID=1828826 RepID=A0A928Z5T0_9CYAN|nr:urease accessory protein UreF [Zarconia navalis]MBE9039637.1 urease accessory protein UreF [Zarconia navalis LEGE 11467]
MSHTAPEGTRDFSLLYLLQLASPALPVGAYSYSEGLETLIERQTLTNADALEDWLERELHLGAIRLEAAVMVRGYRTETAGDHSSLAYWNQWLSAAKETEELRNQSWQMGRALSQLAVALHPTVDATLSASGTPCNFAIAFGIIAAGWQLDERSVLLAYLQSWATNAIGVGVKLIPLGQTIGQQLLVRLYPAIDTAATEILALEDDDLASCGWGLALASMAHETLYSRLFRS